MPKPSRSGTGRSTRRGAPCTTLPTRTCSAEIAARLSAESPSPTVAQRVSTWLTPVPLVDWLLSPAGPGAAQAALQAELEAAALGQPGQVEHEAPVTSEQAPAEVTTWSAATAAGTACHRGQVAFRFVEQVSTLFPPPAEAPPPGPGSALAILAKAALGPPRSGVVTVRVTVTCAGTQGERCAGAVRATDSATGAYLGRRAFAFASGRTRTIALRLSPRTLRQRQTTDLVLSLHGIKGTVAEAASWTLPVGDDEEEPASAAG